MRRRVGVALMLVGLLSTGCGALSKTMTETRLAQRVVQRLEVVHPGSNARVVKGPALRLPGRPDDVSVYSIYAAYKAGGNPDALIDDFLARIAEARPPIPLNWMEAKTRIVPLLAGSRLPAAGPGGLVTVPWDAGLQVVLAFDGSRDFVNLVPADLEGWHVTRDQVYATALENLRERTTSEPMRRARVSDVQGLYLYLWQAKDGLDASRLLLVDEWRKRLLPYIDWDMVMIIPSQDELVVFDGGHRDWVTALQDYTKRQYSAAPNPVSDKLYAFHDGHLVQYNP